MNFVDFMSPSFALEWALRQQQPITAIPTAFPFLNAVCGGNGGGVGIAPGWFVTIGGGTGQGKSLLAQTIAAHALMQGQKVGFLSLEMGHDELACRFYAMTTGTPVRHLERGRFDPNAYSHVDAALWDEASKPGASDGGFLVNTEELESIDDVMAASYWMKEQGVSLIVLDYMQLVSTGDEDNIYRTVTEVGGKMRRWAKKEVVSVLALSQYNTPQGRNTSQPPTMYGLMGGATIAQNGNLVLLLDHSRYKRDEDRRWIARTFMLIEKNRQGDIGEIPIEWDYRTLRVREAMDDEIHLWPERGE